MQKTKRTQKKLLTKLDANIDAQYGVVAHMQELAVKAYGHDKGLK